MGSINPHRFPRPQTLPESKIQIQSQREQISAESGHLTFANMVGRVGGQHTSFGVANEKEESGNPGSFTTSFDLLSIARIVPAKQRRASNPIHISEEQVLDASAVREDPVESSVHGDWPKQPSNVITECPKTPDTAKSMVFRRTIAIPSSRLVRRLPSIFAFEKPKDHKNNQSSISEDPKASSFSFSENRTIASPMETQMLFNKKEIEVSHFHRGSHLQTTKLPSLLDQQERDITNDWVDDFQQDERVSDRDRKDIHGIFGGEDRTVALAKEMDPAAMFQPMPKSTHRSEIDDSIGFTQDFAPLVSLKSCNDSAGTLRAAAVSFKSKQGSNPALAISSISQFEMHTPTSSNPPPKLGSPSDPFAHLLPESFYGKTFKPSILDLASPLSFEKSEGPLMRAAQWKLGDSRSAVQASKEESNTIETAGEVGHKKSSLDDAGISRLWSFSGQEGSNQDVESKLLGSDDSNTINFSPNGKSFSEPEIDPSPISRPSIPRTNPITIRGEAQEQIVPIPRNSPSSDLQIVERLEIKAMVLSECESSIVSGLSGGASVNTYTKNSDVKANPVPQMDEHGRRGAISMRGAVRELGNNGSSDGDPRILAAGSQDGKSPTTETRESQLRKCLEKNSAIKVRVKDKGSNQRVGHWPYPYSTPGVREKEITTESFRKLYEQLTSYTSLGNSYGSKTEKEYWGFGKKKSRSGYLPGEEPWFGGDNLSFFDISFGLNPSTTTGRAPINPPPGLSSTPVARAQAVVEQARVIRVESGDLRDLVESSTPDYNDFGDDHHGLHAKTIQEWNSTPIYGSMLGGTSENIPFAGESVYKNAGGGISDNGRDITLTRDDKALRNKIQIKQLRLGSGLGGSGLGVDVASPTGWPF